MINVTTLIMKLSISHFYMVMFLALHPMESISLNSFVLQEHLAMLLTSTLEQILKVRKMAKIRNRYNQAPQLTQDTNGKVTTSRLDIKNESQEVSPFQAGDHKASTTDLYVSKTKQDRNNINDIT